MKKRILLGSVIFIILATITGILTALLAFDPVMIARLTTVSTILGLGSVGTFFVGLVTPRN